MIELDDDEPSYLYLNSKYLRIGHVYRRRRARTGLVCLPPNYDGQLLFAIHSIDFFKSPKNKLLNIVP